MKALFYTREFPPYVYGGAGVHVEYLAGELAKLMDVDVRCFGDQNDQSSNLTVKGFPFENPVFDGSDDNGLTAASAAKTDGVCVGSVEVCSGVGGWIEPTYTSIPTYEVSESTCDGLDNDCDGSDDNGLTAASASKTAGVCVGSVEVCSGVGGWIEPTYTSITDYEVSETSVTRMLYLAHIF